MWSRVKRRQKSPAVVGSGMRRAPEAELLGQGVEGADAAVGDAADAAGGLIVDGGGSEHGSGTAAKVRFVEAPVDAALAVVQPPS
jgi:hypothetical protein